MADVAVFHPDLSSGGGGEAVCMNVLAALEDDHDVTLYTIVDPDFDALNEYYRTDIDDVTVDRMGRLGTVIDACGQFLRNHTDMTAMRLQSAILNRSLDHGDHDLVVSTYNEFSFTTPAVQYVHHPNFGFKRDSFVYRVYDRLSNAIDGFDKESIRESEVLANSEWTADQFESIYGTRPRVVYPPVDTHGFEPEAWERREPGFVSLGRIEPSKRIVENIGIVDGLRERGHDVHLHIVGPVFEERYANRVRRMVDEREYVTLDGEISRDELVSALCRHRYGLHGKENEHFGMVVAEFVAAGMVPFVPDDGGQCEIVNGEDEFVYGSVEEAVETIDDVLSRRDSGERLRELLPDVEQTYGRTRFREQIRDVVAETVGRER